jgi:hypothetical protein
MIRDTHGVLSGIRSLQYHIAASISVKLAREVKEIGGAKKRRTPKAEDLARARGGARLYLQLQLISAAFQLLADYDTSSWRPKIPGMRTVSFSLSAIVVYMLIHSFIEVCPVCKSSRYLNPNMRFLINPECYHKMCESCVDRIFSSGPASCPVAGCRKTLRKNRFRQQTFEDIGVEREVDIRRRVMHMYAISFCASMI